MGVFMEGCHSTVRLLLRAGEAPALEFITASVSLFASS